jgi:ribA/ribD-fused uncharacterized protein
MKDFQETRYIGSEVCCFRKTQEPFGGLSNMAPGFPLRIEGTRILTTEALYQACRYPHLVDVQREILGQKSPMAAKMKAKPFRQQSRPDWRDIRVDVMRWCLRLKLAFHVNRFGKLLASTAGRPIVEDSHKDGFWGAVRQSADEQLLVGRNVLGRLLMELRDEFLAGNLERLQLVEAPPFDRFTLFGTQIETVDLRHRLERHLCRIRPLHNSSC